MTRSSLVRPTLEKRLRSDLYFRDIVMYPDRL
ncbi:hypothetical protein LINPERHAP1_LOCUS20574 [Linum perenne]